MLFSQLPKKMKIHQDPIRKLVWWGLFFYLAMLKHSLTAEETLRFQPACLG
jgi:hypothetical protein